MHLKNRSDVTFLNAVFSISRGFCPASLIETDLNLTSPEDAAEIFQELHPSRGFQDTGLMMITTTRVATLS
jgi:hypothetical protein